MSGANEQRELKPTPEAEVLYRRWLGYLNDEFTRGTTEERRAEVVRDELYQIYLGHPHGGKANTTLSSELGSAVLAESLHPMNITLAAEHVEGIDWGRFAPRKPLIWFWRMFDRSPLGLNHWLGVRFRCMLGRHIFAGVGKGVAIGCGVEFTFGYGITVEDNVRIRRNAVLDDRRGLVLGSGTVVEEGARVGPEEVEGSGRESLG
ncbi:MAG: hypothetical protein M3O02_02855 [Acidobacteriota bacterium]|nr:hypothetical protein [Acidobacteriota bacterium]